MADAGAAAAAGATAAAASTFAAHEPPARRNGAPEPEPELEPRARPTFRLMGLGAIGRWTPIVEDAGYSPAADGDAAVDFVYQNSVGVRREWKAAHEGAGVWNQLSGMSCMEDKACLAQVQRRMSVPVLRSEVVAGDAFRDWCEAEGVATGELVWMVKDSSANGGADMWVMGAQNVAEVCAQVVADRTYVCQQYVSQPALWKGRKYHLRSFAVITADLQCFLHDTMFLIPAAQQYTLDPASLGNTHVHLTNAAINKHDPEFPGLIPVQLMEQNPDQWGKMLAAVADLTKACSPFLKSQRSPHHFECIGFDFIPDGGATGELWLIEANRMPGLSADGYPNSEEVNDVYHAICKDIFNLLVRPAVRKTRLFMRCHFLMETEHLPRQA